MRHATPVRVDRHAREVVGGIAAEGEGEELHLHPVLRERANHFAHVDRRALPSEDVDAGVRTHVRGSDYGTTAFSI